MEDERYQRLRMLGRGAMGEVWLAEDTLLHRQVALKSLSSVLPSTPTDQQRMMREARLAARLNHPNAVALYDLVVHGSTAYLVMEYVPGISLADHIAGSGRLSVDETARIGAALAEALAEAHRLGIVHRDVKPANILITERGVPKLADFGIARLDMDEHTSTGMMIGTPGYLSPERARGANADGRSDIWALGVTLYTAIEGHAPFGDPGDDAMTVVGRIATALTVPAPLHAGRLTPALLAMLSLDPSRRPSAAQAAEMLRATPPEAERTNQVPSFGGLPAPMHQPAPMHPPAPMHQPPPLPAAAPFLGEPTAPIPQSSGPRSRRRGVLVAVAAVVVIAGGGVAAGIALSGGSSGSPGASGTGSSGSHTSSGSSSGTPARSSPGSSPAVVSGVAYTAPGGISVRAPAGWTEDDSANIPNVRDYVAPGQDRDHGAYFRIGIGNPSPQPSIQDEEQGAIAFLTGPSNPYHDVVVLGHRLVAFLGTTSAEIEYLGTNRVGVRRHGIERLWIANGVTREIVLNTPAPAWTRYESVYAGLLASAHVS